MATTITAIVTHNQAKAATDFPNPVAWPATADSGTASGTEPSASAVGICSAVGGATSFAAGASASTVISRPNRQFFPEETFLISLQAFFVPDLIHSLYCNDPSQLIAPMVQTVVDPPPPPPPDEELLDDEPLGLGGDPGPYAAKATDAISNKSIPKTRSGFIFILTTPLCRHHPIGDVGGGIITH